MLVNFWSGDGVRLLSLPEGYGPEDKWLLHEEAVFDSYAEPNSAGTGWEAYVYALNPADPDGPCLWVVDEDQLAPTGFWTDFLGRRSFRGLRNPEYRGDHVTLRLQTSHVDRNKGMLALQRVREGLTHLANASGIALAIEAVPDSPLAGLTIYVDIVPSMPAMEVFNGVVELCEHGWEEFDDDGWTRTVIWQQPPRERAERVLLDPGVCAANLTITPWSSLARRQVAES